MNAPLDRRGVGRRDALKIGGLTVSLAALVAACGDDAEGEAAGGRVGYQPPITDPPDYPVDDAVLLRTSASVETTVVEMYETVVETGVVEGSLLALLERCIDNHRAIADEMNALAEAAGGQPWPCANPWMVDRLVEPLLEAIDTSDDPARDIFSTVASMENLTAATNQAFATELTDADAAQAALAAATLESRQSAAIVSTVVGYEGYVSPALGGGDVPLSEEGIPLQYAIPFRFGSTGQFELVAGAPNENGVRQTFVLQTPADNSYIYNELEPTC